MKKIVKILCLVSMLICMCSLTACTDDEDKGAASTTVISNTDKIPEENIVDDMEDYIDMLEGE